MLKGLCCALLVLGLCGVAQSQTIVPSNVTNSGGASPIIVDVKHAGWNPANVAFDYFTDPNKDDGYVSFDIAGTGQLAKISWPNHGSGLAWLALDDGSGVIMTGKQLFGNFTPHSDGGVANHPNPNGFLALAWYDNPKQGGDGNLIIDNHDAIWPKLRLWEDNHCWKDPDAPCQSQPEELHTLESEGISSISLVTNGTHIEDKAGNLFKFYAVVNPDDKSEPQVNGHVLNLNQLQKSKEATPRYAFDVYLAARGNE